MLAARLKKALHDLQTRQTPSSPVPQRRPRRSRVLSGVKTQSSPVSKRRQRKRQRFSQPPPIASSEAAESDSESDSHELQLTDGSESDGTLDDLRMGRNTPPTAEGAEEWYKKQEGETDEAHTTRTQRHPTFGIHLAYQKQRVRNNRPQRNTHIPGQYRDGPCIDDDDL